MHPQQEALIKAAAAMGISTQDLSLSWGQDAVRYTRGSASEVIFEGAGLGSTPWLVTATCNELPINRAYFSQLGLPHPAGRFIRIEGSTVERDDLSRQLAEFWRTGDAYSCRPAFDSHGHGLASNLSDLTDVEMHIDNHLADYATWLIEVQPQGDDLQLLVLGGKLHAAIVRKPFGLEGDGIHSLEELIEANNSTPGQRIVTIDADTRQLLREQDIYLGDVVRANRWVQLLPATAGGGDAQDVTDRLHASYAGMVERLCTATGMGFCGIGCRSTDPSGDPSTHLQVLELQARPHWLAFAEAQGGKQDLAQRILEWVFR